MVPPLRKIDKFIWEIPKTYKPCMKVPARIFADESLIEKMKTDSTLEQAANVACLPGVYKYSIALPDAHQGYGFPVGGVAAVDANQGTISPGGIGYDINCLPPGTRILTRFGYTVPIESLIKGGELVSIDRDTKVPKHTKVKLFLWRSENKLIVIRTESGHLLKASADHPILTPKGMINAGDLRVGDKVALYPFEGMPYEEPPDKVILSGNEFPDAIARELRKRGLLPLTARNPKLPILLKLLGYFIGDGSFNGVEGKITAFYGSREGLEEIKRDVEELGYNANIYCRARRIRINSKGTGSHECVLHVSSRSFKALLIALGAPQGKKTHIPFRVPGWIMELPPWMKRLFLAAYFGAGMSKPITINGYNFKHPHVTISKVRELEGSGYGFLNDIAELLHEIGIETGSIQRIYSSGDRVWLRLHILSTPENLVRLWSRVSYEYNPEGKRLANAAVIWLRLKERIINSHEEAKQLAVATAKGGYAKSSAASLTLEYVNEGFIERSIHEGRVDKPRIPRSFPAFEEWYEDRVDGDIVWDVVEEVREEPFNGLVYDLTVNDEAHDFVANGFVVSNCGVRVLRTDLTEDEVRPRLRELVNTIFELAPAGVGETGRLHLPISELNKVLDEGVNWAIRNGYGWADDKDYIEQNGSWGLADSSKVSQRAKERGKDEIGTIGSGNHFIEIQVVDKIFNPDIAKVFGIEREGQVLVMIHSGSRGLGHQVATDYIRIAESKMRQWGLYLPDRELAALPLTAREAQDYLNAMAAAANYAWTNRHLLMHWVRESFRRVFGRDPDKLGMRIIYDVAHNIAKFEEHLIDDEGHRAKVWVHRKGATRAFPAGREEIPKVYRGIGQPVLIPGSMGTGSYILVGFEKSMQLTFGTAPHGAGRQMSRSAAVRSLPPSKVKAALESRGIIIKSAESEIISEEAPEAYKNVDIVAEVSDALGLAKKVVRMRPIGVVKG